MTQRTIKFRAWDTATQKMIANPQTGTILNDSLNNPTSSFIFLQFTGLHDKNGKEIWEGDVVDTIYKRWTVIEKQGCFGIQMRKDFLTLAGLLKMSEPHGNQIEVIGNIYENPDLLQIKKL